MNNAMAKGILTDSMHLPHWHRPRNSGYKKAELLKLRSALFLIAHCLHLSLFFISSPTAPIMNAELQYPLTVQYCSACTMPLEYCEYSDNNACQKQLAECTQEYKARPYVQLATSFYTVKVDPAVVKRQQARKTPAGKNAKSGGNTKIVTRDDKSKEATHIVGLDSFGVNLKEACKIITKKFGTRCNVVPKTNELFIQGNFVCQLFDSLPEMFDAIGIRDIVDKGVRTVASSDDDEVDED